MADTGGRVELAVSANAPSAPSIEESTMIVRLNIGLDNAQSHGLSHLDVSKLLKLAVRDCATFLSARMIEGVGIADENVGDWEPEDVLWAELEIRSSDEVPAFKNAVKSLCVVLQEEAIAVAIVSPRYGDGLLIFNPEYTGEEYAFNLDYFAE